MTTSLRIRGLRKRYTVGLGACVASADVLRGIDLTVQVGESIAIVGEAGAGKSTLLLCLAGLLTADSGEIEWFGERDRSVGARRVMYHVARTDLMRAGSAGESHVHLVDLGAPMHLGTWLSARRDAGDAVVVAVRAIDDVESGIDRVHVLRGGVLRPFVRTASRVAEGAGLR